MSDLLNLHLVEAIKECFLPRPKNNEYARRRGLVLLKRRHGKELFVHTDEKDVHLRSGLELQEVEARSAASRPLSAGGSSHACSSLYTVHLVERSLYYQV